MTFSVTFIHSHGGYKDASLKAWVHEYRQYSMDNGVADHVTGEALRPLASSGLGLGKRAAAILGCCSIFSCC